MQEPRGRWPDCAPHLKLMSVCKYDVEEQMKIVDCLFGGQGTVIYTKADEFGT